MTDDVPPPLLFSKKNFYLLLLFFFVLPYFLAMGFALSHVPVAVGKNIILAAFLGLVASGGASYFLLRGYEKMMQQKVALLVKQKVESIGAQSVLSYEKELNHLKGLLDEQARDFEHQMDLLQSSSAKSKARAEELEFDLEKKQVELRLNLRELEDLRKEIENLTNEIRDKEEKGAEEARHRQGLIAEYQQTIHEQRAIIEKKQRYIAKLEEKVRDQMYEIRSLLQLDGAKTPIQEFPEQKEELAHYYLPSPHTHVHTPYDLSLVLQRYVNNAERFTTLSSKEKRFLGEESMGLDLRYLFETLREESAGILFVYSLRERKLLFANQQSKVILGWSPEKLIKDFSGLLVRGENEWKDILSKLSREKEARGTLTIALKSGEAIPMQLFIERITSGPFLHHAVGLLAPV